MTCSHSVILSPCFTYTVHLIEISRGIIDINDNKNNSRDFTGVEEFCSPQSGDLLRAIHKQSLCLNDLVISIVNKIRWQGNSQNGRIGISLTLLQSYNTEVFDIALQYAWGEYVYSSGLFVNGFIRKLPAAFSITHNHSSNFLLILWKSSDLTM